MYREADAAAKAAWTRLERHEKRCHACAEESRRLLARKPRSPCPMASVYRSSWHEAWLWARALGWLLRYESWLPEDFVEAQP
jgi:hypothetical protein